MGTLLDDLADLTGTVGVSDPPRCSEDEADGVATAAAGAELAIPVGGQALRYALSLELLRAGELSIADLIDRLVAAGLRVEGRASKVVSDALRWEIGHGRVVRVGRGRYRTGKIPRSTIWWMRRALDLVRSRWSTAVDGAPVVGAPVVGAPVVGAPDASPPVERERPLRRRPSGLTLYRRSQRAAQLRRDAWGPSPTFRRPGPPDGLPGTRRTGLVA